MWMQWGNKFQSPGLNSMKRALAIRKHNLLMTAGSDSHHLDGLGGGGMSFFERLNSIEDFIQAVKNQAYTLT